MTAEASVRSYTQGLVKLLHARTITLIRPRLNVLEKIARREKERLSSWAGCSVQIRNIDDPNVGGILVTNNLEALRERTHTVLIPKGEREIDRQNFRRFLIPLGQDGAGLNAAYGCLNLARALPATLVFYHTTWRKPNIASSDPWDHMTEKSRQIVRQAIALAEHGHIPYELALEIEAPGVPEGIVRAANVKKTCLIVMAYSSFNRKGSKAESVAAITNLPLLVIGNHDTGVNNVPIPDTLLDYRPPYHPVSEPTLPNPWFTIKRVMGIAILFTVIKAIAKIALGQHLHSRAIAADGYHSLSDALPDLIVMWAATMAKRRPDHHYPLGRGNINNLITLGTGIALTLVCANVAFMIVTALYQALHRETVTGFHLTTHELPYALTITLLSTAISFGVGSYQMLAGKKTREPSLSVDGAEMRSDGLIELATAGGLCGAYFFQAPWIEHVLGGLMICCIGRTAYEFLTSGVNGLLQKSLGPSAEQKIREMIGVVPGLEQVRELKTFAIGGTTAVVMLKIEVTLGVRGAVVQTAIRSAIDTYFSTAEDFSRHELWIEECEPSPTHRIAIAVNGDAVAPRLTEAQELWICEVKTNGDIATINHVAIHHLALAERIDLLVTKKARSLILFFTDEPMKAMLGTHDIMLEQSLTLSPDTFFTT